jgi:glycosyltransferase involved in cell wall biosynthesis
MPQGRQRRRGVGEAARVKRIRVAVVAKLEDHKLVQKLQPFVAMPEVEELVLIRRRPLQLAGVRNVCPPAAIADVTALAEPWRLLSALRAVRGWPRERSFLVSFFLMPHALHADVVGRLRGIPTVPVALSQEDVEQALQHSLIRRAVRRAHAVGVRGARSRQLLTDAGIANVFEPPNVHDLATFEPAPPGSADLDVVYAGALVPVKQLELLLRALALVKARRPGLRAAIVGGGYLRASLEALAAELGLREQLEFAGPQPQHEVARWLRRARVFVMTSRVEGLPMAMIEALSCGVPVVLPDVGDVTTVARDGENAWIVRQPSADAYADAIATLLSDEARRARLAVGALQARARFADEYSLEAAQRAWRRALWPAQQAD